MYRQRLLLGVAALCLLQMLIMYPSIRVNQIFSQSQVDIFNPDLNLEQDDPLILNFIKQHHIFPPPTNRTRRLTKPALSLKSKGGQELVDVLDIKRPGFFIECGANDGEFFSNTIELEVKNKWTGLLIEGSPAVFEKLKSKNRNAWLTNVCLSGQRPEKLEFLKHKAKFPEWRVGNGKINPGEKYDKPADLLNINETFKRQDYVSEGSVNCFPLFSVLSAINVTTVDFFSLDVEGHEYKILAAIPFDKIHIEVIFVEHWLAPEGKLAIRKLIEGNGYSLLRETESEYIFQKKSK